MTTGGVYATTKPTMKPATATILSLLCLPLSSCLFQTHSKIYQLGCEYEGVSILDRNTCYRINGRDYIKGQRTRLTNHYDSWWFDPCEGCYYRPIEGTQGEIVYHEVYHEKGDKYTHTRGEWITLDTPNARPRQIDGELIGLPTHYPTKHSEIYTPWALLTTPAALASAIVIDIPVTLGFFTVGGLYHLTVGQQQQPTTPEKP